LFKASLNGGMCLPKYYGIMKSTIGWILPESVKNSAPRYDFYRNTPMLASGIKGMRVQLGNGSDRDSISFMQRRLGCTASSAAWCAAAVSLK
jgi:hypothetical protein